MTSVGVVSSVVERMKCLRNLEKNSGRFPKEAEGLLSDLEEMKELLAAAYRGKIEPGAKLEKEVVRISYDVVYTITVAFKPASISDKFKKSGSSKLRELQVQLKLFKEELHQRVFTDQTASLVRNLDSSAASPPAKKAGTELKPKEHHFKTPTRRHNGILSLTRKLEMYIKNNNLRSGSHEQPESMSGSKINTEGKTHLLGRLKTDLLSKKSKDDPREVYIMGESGIGKSTVVSELYNDQEIRNFFDVFGWVTVGHTFQIKRVLQLLLQQLGQLHEEDRQLGRLREMNQIELISQIFDVVRDKTYLLVLEDIGSVQDWESIHIALPLANSTRVIITTSSNDFLSRPHCYKMLGLTHSETLTLLSKEASFDSDVGGAVFRISNGSPLYAKILGKSLKSEANDKDLVEELHSYESMKGTPHVIGVCYTRLSPELKTFFLYLAQFPPCHNIPVDKLYMLLSAENLISPRTLIDYLKVLVDLMLVEADEDLLSGLYKSCRLHNQVREFCKSQGFEEEFIEIVDFESSKQAVRPYTPRLAIYITKYNGDATFRFKGPHAAKKVLSLMIFDEFNSNNENSRYWPSKVGDLADFAHLRVLSFDEVDFRLRKLPRGLEKLLFLRFLSFRGCFLEELPSCLDSLKQLETLDLLVQDECKVTIPENVFDAMKSMVHLFLPRKYQGKGKTGEKLSLVGMEILERLVNFNTGVFNVYDLRKLKNLRIFSTVLKGESAEEMDAVVDLLKQRKEEVLHSSVEITSFDCYNRASILALRKLLQCEFVCSVKVEGRITKLPAEGGGRRIAELVFQGSKLELDPMKYFGKFKNLRSLTLANEAFIGDVLVIPPSPLFLKLRSLKLQNLLRLKRLTIEEGALPQLSSLQIKSCGKALELTIPKDLYHRLKNEIGGDAYSVVPLPSKFNTTP